MQVVECADHSFSGHMEDDFMDVFQLKENQVFINEEDLCHE
jgi:hypothetical protein